MAWWHDGVIPSKHNGAINCTLGSVRLACASNRCCVRCSECVTFPNVRVTSLVLMLLPRAGQVLVQEFLAGTEYVVDTVSRDGEHKVF